MEKGLFTLLLLIVTTASALAAPVNTSGPWGISVSGFNNFSTACSATSTLGKTIVIDKAVTVNNKSVTGRTIKVIQGGSVNVSSGKTLTMPLPDAGKYQIFSGSGTVKFSPNIGDVIPEWFGAKGDGTTDDTSAFTVLEAGAYSRIYLSGTYKTTLSSVTKMYNGPGSLLYKTGIALSGTPSQQMQAKNDWLYDYNARYALDTPRSIVFIGDSITFGSMLTGRSQTYPYLIQQFLNNRLRFTQGNFLSGSVVDYNDYTLAGTYTRGTSGPLGASIILQPGASITFTADNLNYLGFWYQRTAASGTITITRNGATVMSANTAGTTASDVFSEWSTFSPGTANDNYVLSASVAPVELTGIAGTHQIVGRTPFIQVHARGGYATANFTSAAAQASIAAQALYNSLHPIYVLALGTNDIYNPATAVSSATYKANLLTIVNGLKTSGIPVLTVPLKATETTYHPVYEPFENYRRAVYEVAAATGFKVIDLSSLDLDVLGLYGPDGLHPDFRGTNAMASKFFSELNLGSVAVELPAAATITPFNGATTIGAPYDIPSFKVIDGNSIIMAGTIGVATPVAGTVIATLPVSARPSKTKIFNVPGWVGAGTLTTVVLKLEANGNLSILNKNAPTDYIALDGLCYSTY